MKLKIPGKSMGKSGIIVFDLSYLPVAAVATSQVRYHEKIVKNTFFRRVLPLRWLRDHDRSTTGYNHKTFQRKVETFSIDPNILKIKNIREENSVIHI